MKKNLFITLIIDSCTSNLAISIAENEEIKNYINVFEEKSSKRSNQIIILLKKILKLKINLLFIESIIDISSDSSFTGSRISSSVSQALILFLKNLRFKNENSKKLLNFYYHIPNEINYFNINLEKLQRFIEQDFDKNNTQNKFDKSHLYALKYIKIFKQNKDELSSKIY